jgi:cell wall-associated NlpC family hydrolase
VARRRTDTTCVVAVAAVRATPGDDAEQVTQLLFGEAVGIEGEDAGWTRIRTAYDYPGWVRTADLATDDLVAEARAYLGVPYEWGGMSDRGIDCSGLVHMAFRRIGVTVPRDADQQEDAGVEIDEDQLRPGDLVTYGDELEADHIAIWVGEGAILHATGREDVQRVVEEPEPPALRSRRRKLFRLGSLDSGSDAR